MAMASTSKLADVQDEERAERIKSKFKEERAQS
jgi:hypothetical protein